MKIKLDGVRAVGGGAANRNNIFNKEWLYMNVQSEHGATVTVSVSFKSAGGPMRATLPSLNKNADMGTTG